MPPEVGKMKKLIPVLLALVFFSSAAFSGELTDIAKAQVAESARVIDAFNVIYPELKVSVGQPAQETVLIRELAILRATLHGQTYQERQLLHLTCCSRACGSDGSGCKR